MKDQFSDLETIPNENKTIYSFHVIPISRAQDHYKKNSFINYSPSLKFKSINFGKEQKLISQKVKDNRFWKKGFTTSYKKLEFSTKIPIINIGKSSSKMIIFSKGLEGMSEVEKEEFFKAKNKNFKVNDESFTP